MKALRWLLLPLLLACTAQPALAQDAPAESAANTYTPPKVIGNPVTSPRRPSIASGSSKELAYPENAQRRGMEGLVFARFDLDASGKPTNVRIDPDGFHVDIFGPAVKRWVSQSVRFNPAMENGEPVALQGLRLPVRFSMNMKPGITREFREEIDKVVKLLDARDFPGAHHHAQWMLTEKAKLNYEYAVLQATLANTLARTGKMHAALDAARAATDPVRPKLNDLNPLSDEKLDLSEQDFLLPGEMTDQLLRLRFILAASQGLDFEAAQSYAYLRALGKIDAADVITSEAEKILVRLKSAPSLTGTVQVDESGHWTHLALLPYLAVRDVEGGAITQLIVHCSGPDIGYNDPAQIPAIIKMGASESGYCQVAIFASPGTRMHLIEYRQPPP
ncbi:MAG: TonB family protein [Nevskiaceae bacterium]|jgi:TonB family protein|nr:TonB family protein [Nevskiaceae bacterium]